ncbi:hypothetical protein [Jiangella alkaliphila]|uniref:DUF1707 domain-containing protein n=1 Tax=Jiangella alkaliphila TaxID=419479 RepID=A0A1H2L930_9ACTN|nr:hypothetical protein [Jiangella alkaliphila]SDU77334.1 hypothetical protein SAMN04488563_5501 [Jiangella alkaliphila]
MELNGLTRRLLWPDTVPAGAEDKARALAVLAARRDEGLPDAEARSRTEAVAAATTRNDLYLALEGLGGGVPPWGVTMALRVATGVWIAMTAVQIVVWLAIGIGTGGLDVPWWLYSTAGGAGIVAALWWANESYHRVPGRARSRAIA